MGYANALDQQTKSNKRLFILCLGLCGLLAGAMWGWSRAPKDLTCHMPPDLRSGAHLKVGEVPAPNVYAFAHYIWQQVNRWQSDGDKDYGMAIFKMAPYLTPSCRQRLESDMQRKANAGELSGRVRALQEIVGRGYSEERVVPQGNGLWSVTLDTEIVETVRGVAVKSAYIRYPLRVVQFSGDREANPFQLAVDCWSDSEEPSKIDMKAELQAMAKAQEPRSPAGGAAGAMQDSLTSKGN